MSVEERLIEVQTQVKFLSRLVWGLYGLLGAGLIAFMVMR